MLHDSEINTVGGFKFPFTNTAAIITCKLLQQPH